MALDSGTELEQTVRQLLDRLGHSKPDRGVADGSVGKGKLATDALNAFVKLATPADRVQAIGGGTINFASSAIGTPVAVPHGLGRTPLRVFLQLTTLVGVWLSPGSYNSTSFTVSGAANASINQNVTFDWLAIG